MAIIQHFFYHSKLEYWILNFGGGHAPRESCLPMTSLSESSLSFPSLRIVLFSATVLRIGLILYSEWHDSRSLVKYTDVDYRVFSDAAAFVFQPGDANQAQGPLKQLLGYQLDIGECVVTNRQVTMSDTIVIIVLILEKHTGIHHCSPSYSPQIHGCTLPLGNIYFPHAIS